MDQNNSVGKNVTNNENNNNLSKYNEKSTGLFMVFVESGVSVNNNLGKINYVKIAKEIFDMKLNNVIRIRS